MLQDAGVSARSSNLAPNKKSSSGLIWNTFSKKRAVPGENRRELPMDVKMGHFSEPLLFPRPDFLSGERTPPSSGLFFSCLKFLKKILHFCRHQ